MADITTATNIDKMVDTTTQSNSTMMDTASDLSNAVTVDDAEVPSSTTAWLDRLPTEVRIEIFKLAQKHKGVLLVVDERNKDVIVDVSLLVALVNDKKSIEAVEGFFTANTFRLTKYAELASSDLGLADGAGDAFKYITHLELRNLAVSIEFMSEEGLQLVMKACGAMPRLRGVTVAYDTVAVDPQSTLSTTETLRKSLAGMGYDGLDGWKLECVEIGKYIMSKSTGLKITFVHVGLMEAWANMKKSPPVTFKSQVEALAKVLREQPGSATEMPGSFGFVLNLSLAAWVSIWERICTHCEGSAMGDPDVEFSEDELNLMELFMQRTHRGLAVAKLRGRVVVGHALRELDEESVRYKYMPETSVKHPQVMEDITDLLRLNGGMSPGLATGGGEYWRERTGNLGQTMPEPVYEDGEDEDVGQEDLAGLELGDEESGIEEGQVDPGEDLGEN
ncbi:hypothetical protein LTS10_008511 [Elasticomyces elasticus]|nr:hypothetical protein LTS10_008511 [Elasticomyces elasticus]